MFSVTMTASVAPTRRVPGRVVHRLHQMKWEVGQGRNGDCRILRRGRCKNCGKEFSDSEQLRMLCRGGDKSTRIPFPWDKIDCGDNPPDVIVPDLQLTPVDQDDLGMYAENGRA